MEGREKSLRAMFDEMTAGIVTSLGWWHLDKL